MSGRKKARQRSTHLHLGESLHRWPCAAVLPELLDGTLEKMVNAQRTGGFLKQPSLVHLVEKFVDGSLDALGEFIHVLGLESNTDAAFLNGDEKIPEFAFREGFDDAFQIGFLVQPVAKVWGHTARKGTDGRGFPHAVRTENADDTFLGWGWKAEQAKAVHGITMNHIRLEFTGQIFNDQRIMRALVDADATTDAEAF